MSKQEHFESQIENYAGGNFKIPNGREIKCYTKKQMHALYPKKSYKLIGEYKAGSLVDDKDCIGDIGVDSSSLPITKYKSNNRIIYSEKGYLKCAENSFVVLLKNVLFKRLIILFLGIVLIAGGTYCLLHKNNLPETITKLLNIDPNATDWDEDSNNTKQPVPKGTKIPGFGSITIPANTTNIQVSLGNPEENSCYFLISLYLEDGTELFKSELIPPGKGLNSITLSKPLAPGDYNAVLKYQTFNLDTQKEMNGANLNIKIISK